MSDESAPQPRAPRQRDWLQSGDWLWPGLILLIVGAGLRWSTFNLGERYLAEAARRLAYSDVVVFYDATNRLPYLERRLEYPPLTGLAIWVAGLMPGGKQGYFLTSAILLSAALIATFFLIRASGAGVRLPYFALAPGLAFYGTLNWDALAVVALAAAIVATRRGRFALAGIALGLGASAKLFPLYLAPALLAHTLVVGSDPLQTLAPRELWFRLRAAAPRRFLGGLLGALAVINVPLALIAPSEWSYFLRFQAGRTYNIDAIWAVLPTVPDRAQTIIVAVTFLGGVGWSARRVLRGASWEDAALIALLAFLVSTKVYSPQYGLWLLPLLAILAVPLWLWLAYIAADGGYYWAISHVYASGEFSPLFASIWMREAALCLLLGWAARRLLRADPRQAIRYNQATTTP